MTYLFMIVQKTNHTLVFIYLLARSPLNASDKIITIGEQIFLIVNLMHSVVLVTEICKGKGNSMLLF